MDEQCSVCGSLLDSCSECGQVWCNGEGFRCTCDRDIDHNIHENDSSTPDDKVATYTVTSSSGGKFKILMRLIESKKQYGRVDWLCAPVSGEGEIWLSEGSLEMRPEGETE